MEMVCRRGGKRKRGVVCLIRLMKYDLNIDRSNFCSNSLCGALVMGWVY